MLSTTIRGKVNSINEHIYNLIKDPLTKLNVAISVAVVQIQNLFVQKHKWVFAKMHEHIQEVNGMFVKNAEGFRNDTRNMLAVI